MKYLFLSLFFYTLFFPTVQAEERCHSSLFPKLKLNFYIKKEEPKLIAVPSSEFQNSFLKTPDHPVGVTLSKTGLEITNIHFSEKILGGNESCIYPESMDVSFMLTDFMVLIDSKYPTDSCEYNTILDHEALHVHIANETIEFYAKDVYLELMKIIDLLPASKIRSPEEAKIYAQSVGQTILDEMRPVLNFIDKKKSEKNNEIDSEKNYQMDTARCQNW